MTIIAPQVVKKDRDEKFFHFILYVLVNFPSLGFTKFTWLKFEVAVVTCGTLVQRSDVTVVTDFMV